MESLQRSPYPYDRDLKGRLIEHYQILQLVSTLNGLSDYRRTLRMRIPVSMQPALWNCQMGAGDRQQLDLACPAGAGEAEVRAVVERLRTDREIAEQLNFRTSNQILATREIDGRVRQGKALIAEVKAKGGR